MAGKSLPPFQIVTAGDMSGNITSTVTDVRNFDNVAVELVFTGTPTGTFSVEGSLDYGYQAGGNFNPAVNAGTWTALSLSPTPAASGGAGSVLLDLNQISFAFIRVKYAFTSGTGTLNAYIAAKAV